MSALLPSILWSFLPSRITAFALPYLSAYLPSLFPPAQKGTEGYVRNYRYAYTLLVTLYLAYNFYNDGRGRSGGGQDWYALLGVRRLATDNELRKAFRTLSRTHHPDRASSTSNAGLNSGQTSDDTFILLRKAYETLSNPTTRYAYDRFGPDILTWGIGEGNTLPDPVRSVSRRAQVSERDWMEAGVLRSCGFYIVSGGIMGLMWLFGFARHGAKTRLLLLLLLLNAELLLILCPTPSTHAFPLFSLLASLVPQSVRPILSAIQPLFSTAWTHLLFPIRGFLARPQYLQIRTLHRVFTSVSIGVSQLAGVWANKGGGGLVGRELEAFDQQLGKEAVIILHQEIIPQRGKPPSREIEANVLAGIKLDLMARVLSTHPTTRSAFHRELYRAQQAVVAEMAKQTGIIPASLAHLTPALTPDGPSLVGQDGILSDDHADQVLADRRKAIVGEQQRRQMEYDLQLARRIALPLTPPGSPRTRPVGL